MSPLLVGLALAGLGVPELLIILAVVLLLFGGTKLAGLGKSTGRALREFKEETKGLTEKEQAEADRAEDQRVIDAEIVDDSQHQPTDHQPVDHQPADQQSTRHQAPEQVTHPREPRHDA